MRYKFHLTRVPALRRKKPGGIRNFDLFPKKLLRCSTVVPFSALFACHFLAVEHLSSKLSPAGEVFCFCLLCSASFLCSAFLCSAPFLWLCSAPFLLLSLCFFSLLCSALLTLLLWCALPLLFAVLFCLLLLCLFSCSSAAILPAALVSSGQLAKKHSFRLLDLVTSPFLSCLVGEKSTFYN